MILYEAGARKPDGGYYKFIESPDKAEVLEYTAIMQKVFNTAKAGFEIVLLEKVYSCVSTTPYIITEKGDDK